MTVDEALQNLRQAKRTHAAAIEAHDRATLTCASTALGLGRARHGLEEAEATLHRAIDAEGEP